MIFEMMMGDKFFDIISFIVLTFSYNKNSFKMGYAFQNFWNSFDKIDKPFRNSWPSKK
jgi:hypothetical protein